jgi:molecular chaperone IbpA
LALGPFLRRFELADHVGFVGANSKTACWSSTSKRENPRADEPARRIAINADSGEKLASKRIEGNVAA